MLSRELSRYFISLEPKACLPRLNSHSSYAHHAVRVTVTVFGDAMVGFHEFHLMRAVEHARLGICHENISPGCSGRFAFTAVRTWPSTCQRKASG